MHHTLIVILVLVELNGEVQGNISSAHLNYIISCPKWCQRTTAKDIEFMPSGKVIKEAMS